MKRVYCFTVFVLLLCLSNITSAQLPGSVTVDVGDGNDTSGANPSDYQGCQRTYSLSLIIYNLDYINGENYSDWELGDDIPPNLSLPADYEPMFLQCELGGFVDTVKVDSFYFHPTESGYDFVFSHEMSVNFCKECIDKDYSYKIDLEPSLTLLTANLDALPFFYTYYPVCDYTSTNDLFDCYYLTNDDCPMKKCDNEDWAKWEGNLSFRCGNTYEVDPELTPGPEPIITDSTGTREEAVTTELFVNNFEAFPNPFQSEINIKWNVASEKSLFYLYNLNGQLLKSWMYPKHEVGEISKISVDDLPNGVYFLTVQIGGKIKHQKLIKT